MSGRILFLLTQDLQSPSGLGRYLPLARELVRQGYTVHVAALHADYESLPEKRLQQDGIDVHYVAPMHVQKRGNIKRYYSPPRLLLLMLRATFALTRAALTTPADIVHLGKPHPMNSVAGLLAKLLKRRKVFVDCDDYEAGVNRFQGQWQRRIIAFFEDWAPRWTHFVTTNTHFTRDRLLGLGTPPEKIAYIPNGVAQARFAPPDPARVETACRELGLEGKQVVTFIGSLSLPGHPVDLLLEAFAQVRERQPGTVLLLVGGGEDYAQLQQQARAAGIGQHVIFAGRVPPQDVPIYYHLSDVSVDPVHDDDAARGRSPLKLFESWACGVPFATADVGDRQNLIGDPPAGLLAAPGDPASLAEAILKILQDSALARALRENGLARISDFYWARLAQQLDAVYRKVISDW